MPPRQETLRRPIDHQIDLEPAVRLIGPDHFGRANRDLPGRVVVGIDRLVQHQARIVGQSADEAVLAGENGYQGIGLPVVPRKVIRSTCCWALK